MSQNNFQLSCEFFPPKTERGVLNLIETAKRLNAIHPQFFSVTCGAGGSEGSWNLHIVEALTKNIKTPVLPHITCIGATEEKVLDLLKAYQSLGVKQVLALRGDLPKEVQNPLKDFQHASDLVCFIRKHFNDTFKIGVAAYPEKHPEAETLQKDIQQLKCKMDCGADFAITQYFYEADHYERFLELCAKVDITFPIIPGILPILNWGKVVEFSKLCHAHLPERLQKKMSDLSEVDQKHYGLEMVINLCHDLMKLKVSGLHFYALNKFELVLNICQQLHEFIKINH